jgi:transcription initiation factor TFIID subunit 13
LVSQLKKLFIHFIKLHFSVTKTIKVMEFNKTNKIQIEDLMCILRKDPRKYARAKDLLIMNEELKRARKAFEEATKY